MATAEDDRRWVIEQWQYLFDRMPTAAELEYEVGRLQRGEFTRTTWMAGKEKRDSVDTVTRLYREVLGREPDPGGLAYWAGRLANGTITRAGLTQTFSGSTEGLLRTPTTTPDAAQENARDYLASVLESYGLGGMGDWAWEQIQSGYTNERILQNLRDTDQYKQRFAGLEARRAAGLNAITEAEYIAYETSARQLMRAAGMPADFYDQPSDFADLIGKDVSVSELNARINEGYLAASQAPTEVRSQLRDLYGIGEGDMAAYFMDPDRALPLIQRQYAAASVAGAAQMTGYGTVSASEAERVASYGVDLAQAQQGFEALTANEELFGTLPGEQEGLIDRETQLGAVFGGDARARERIERKAGARRSAGSGAQSFTVGQEGVTGLSRR